MRIRRIAVGCATTVLVVCGAGACFSQAPTTSAPAPGFDAGDFEATFSFDTGSDQVDDASLGDVLETPGDAAVDRQVADVSVPQDVSVPEDVSVPVDGASAPDSTADSGQTLDGAEDDGGDAGVTGNGWLSASCVYTDGTFCIGYTIPRCADQDPYGNPCSSPSFPGGPVNGPRLCSQDTSSTTYRCLHQWCAYGCIPGGSTTPDYNWVPVFTCGSVGGC